MYPDAFTTRLLSAKILVYTRLPFLNKKKSSGIIKSSILFPPQQWCLISRLSRDFIQYRNEKKKVKSRFASTIGYILITRLKNACAPHRSGDGALPSTGVGSVVTCILGNRSRSKLNAGNWGALVLMGLS